MLVVDVRRGAYDMAIIQTRTRRPLIGSGKIKRRIASLEETGVSIRQEPFVFNRKNWQDVKKAAGQNESNLDLKRSDIRILFEYWNSLGKPFTKHKTTDTDVAREGVKHLERAINKHGKDVVLKAIKSCRELFDQDWFAFKQWPSIKRLPGIKPLSLAAFFRFDSRTLARIQQYNRKLSSLNVVSWFVECQQNREYMEAKFCRKLQDTNPYFTEQLTNIWLEACRIETLPPHEHNTIIKIGKQAKTFSDKTGYDVLAIPSRLRYLILERGDRNRKITIAFSLNQYLSERFWYDAFPKELIRYGSYRSKSEMGL